MSQNHTRTGKGKRVAAGRDRPSGKKNRREATRRRARGRRANEAAEERRAAIEEVGNNQTSDGQGTSRGRSAERRPRRPGGSRGGSAEPTIRTSRKPRQAGPKSHDVFLRDLQLVPKASCPRAAVLFLSAPRRRRRNKATGNGTKPRNPACGFVTAMFPNHMASSCVVLSWSGTKLSPVPLLFPTFPSASAWETREVQLRSSWKFWHVVSWPPFLRNFPRIPALALLSLCAPTHNPATVLPRPSTSLFQRRSRFLSSDAWGQARQTAQWGEGKGERETGRGPLAVETD